MPNTPPLLSGPRGRAFATLVPVLTEPLRQAALDWAQKCRAAAAAGRPFPVPVLPARIGAERLDTGCIPADLDECAQRAAWAKRLDELHQRTKCVPKELRAGLRRAWTTERLDRVIAVLTVLGAQPIGDIEGRTKESRRLGAIAVRLLPTAAGWTRADRSNMDPPETAHPWPGLGVAPYASWCLTGALTAKDGETTAEWCACALMWLHASGANGHALQRFNPMLSSEPVSIGFTPPAPTPWSLTAFATGIWRAAVALTADLATGTIAHEVAQPDPVDALLEADSIAVVLTWTPPFRNPDSDCVRGFLDSGGGVTGTLAEARLFSTVASAKASLRALSGGRGKANFAPTAAFLRVRAQAVAFDPDESLPATNTAAHHLRARLDQRALRAAVAGEGPPSSAKRRM